MVSLEHVRSSEHGFAAGRLVQDALQLFGCCRVLAETIGLARPVVVA
ncbi:hypothetical protein ACFPRL_29600 [Pseudoclavibacter helvolus]